MQISIIHMRDPDSECYARVFVDDVEVTDFSWTDLDPGRGWSDEDWQERIDDVDTSTAFGRRLREELIEMKPVQRKWAL